MIIAMITLIAITHNALMRPEGRNPERGQRLKLTRRDEMKCASCIDYAKSQKDPEVVKFLNQVEAVHPSGLCQECHDGEQEAIGYLSETPASDYLDSNISNQGWA